MLLGPGDVIGPRLRGLQGSLQGSVNVTGFELCGGFAVTGLRTPTPRLSGINLWPDSVTRSRVLQPNFLVLALWHEPQRTHRLSSSQVPPLATGMRWSTSSSDLAPHIWQVNRSRASTWARMEGQLLGRLRFLADVFCQDFRIWCSRQRPSRKVLVVQPARRQILAALGNPAPPRKSLAPAGFWSGSRGPSPSWISYQPGTNRPRLLEALAIYSTGRSNKKET